MVVILMYNYYRFKPGASVLQLGFQAIDVSQIGPRKRFKQEER